MITQFSICTPILTVRDITKAVSFYIDKLGFTLDFQWGEPLAYAGIRRDAVCIHLIHERASRQISGTGSVAITANEVDAYHALCVRAGVDVLVPPGNRPYGLRDFSVHDPDGNIINIGCELAHA